MTHVTKVDDTFDALQALPPGALDGLLPKTPKIRAPWWIHKGKTTIADAAAARVGTFESTIQKLAELSFSSDCHGPALA